MKNKKEKHENKYNINYEDYDRSPTVLGTELTGLVPTPPVTEFEEESYTALADIPKPKETKLPKGAAPKNRNRGQR